jgi:FkbM family methyltransferase
MTIAAARHGVCVQAGGHVGLWPLKLAQSFERVLSFEPEPALFESLRLNTKDSNIEVHRAALGSTQGRARMRPHIKAGSWSIEPDGSFDVPVEMIDGLGLISCDCIVLDVEGYEVEALKGARQTIERCRPAIHVEQLRAHKKCSESFLRSIGYVERGRAGNDALYLPA